MKKTASRSAILTLFMTLFMISGCVPAEFRLRELPENPAVPVTVAALLPLTGSNRIYAEQMREGLLCAEDRVNDTGGISGRQLKLEILDTSGTPEGTRDALAAAAKAGASGIIAGYDTEEVSMIIAHASRMRTPMVIPLATSNHHLQTSPFVYRNCFSDTQQMEVLANYLLYWRQRSRGAIITDQHNDDDYTRGISRSFAMAAKDIHIFITTEMTIAQDEELTIGQLQSILMTDPGFIMVSARCQRSAKLIKQIRQAGFTGIICGPDSWDDPDLCNALTGSDPGDCVFTSFFSEENKSVEYQDFSKKFNERFFHIPGACET